MSSDDRRDTRKSSISRRTFMRRSAVGAVGLALADGILTESALLGQPIPIRAIATSKVVLIRDSRVIDSSGKVQQPLLQEMLDRALTTFTGESTIGDAWREFVKPEEVIGLKLNANSVPQLRGSELTAHFPALASAVLSGFGSAGIAEENVILWDRNDEEVASMGFTIQKDAGALRALGTQEGRRGGGPGFSSESFPVGNRSSKVSRIASEMCSALINMPVLKTHSTTGVTGALKNHYGSIDNPSQYHRNSGTNPGVAEVAAIPAIRDKERLILCDGLLGVYNGGPQWQRQFIWPYGGILVGTDPVAMDAIALKILDEKRQAEGMSSLARQAPSLDAAEALGLGTRNLDQIELQEILLG
jgi:uncharacterized protein (DUF362 family)